MPKYISVGRVEDYPPGKGSHIFVHGEPIALFQVDGNFFAINYVCPHMGGPLGEGMLNGFVVNCPWHNWTFDIRTGLADYAGGHSVSAYEVLVENGEIKIGWLKQPES